MSLRVLSLRSLTTVISGLLFMTSGTASQSNTGCSTSCIEIYSPVCASNGQSYSNSCYFNVANCQSGYTLSIVSSGLCPCQEPGTCPPEFDPLCGTNNRNYTNACELQVANDCSPSTFPISKLHDGLCTREVRDRICSLGLACTAEYRPVCGSNQRTYGNRCEWYTANICRGDGDFIDFLYEGECSTGNPSACDEACPEIYSPLCASNQQTYSNDCVFRMTNCRYGNILSIVKRGLCDCPFAKTCDYEYKPICGTDNRNYSSMCELEVAQKCVDTSLVVLHRGLCTLENRRIACANGIACTREYDPVCGSDGHTYSNPCVLRSSNICRGTGAYIRVRHEGKCRSSSGDPYSDDPSSARQIGGKLGVMVTALVLFLACWYRDQLL